MSDAVRQTLVVASQPSAIMDVIADFEAYPEWQDEVTEVEILETDEQGRGRLVRYVIDAKVFTTTYVLAYDFTDSTMAWHLAEGKEVDTLEGSYVLADRGDGTTEVTYSLEVALKAAVPGFVRRVAARRIVDSALRAMQRRVESRA